MTCIRLDDSGRDNMRAKWTLYLGPLMAIQTVRVVITHSVEEQQAKGREGVHTEYLRAWKKKTKQKAF